MSSKYVDTTLGQIIDRKEAILQTGPFGTTLKAKEYSSIGTPVISVGEIREGFLQIHSNTPRVCKKTVERLSKFLLKENDIVFGRKGSTHRNALIKKFEEGYFLGSDGIRLRVISDSICSKFLSYQLRSSKAEIWLRINSEGTTMPSLNQDILSRFPILLPPLFDQKGIAHILGTLDMKIELNKKTNEILEEIAQALFKSWFIDFDPVKAKVEGRSTGLPNEISELFPDSFEDSELGEIPSGWTISQLKNFISLDSGLPYKGKLKGEGEGYLLTMGCADKYLRFKSKGVYKYPSDIPEKHIVRPGDIIVCSHDLTQARDQLGQPFIVPTTYEGKITAAATNTFIVRSKQENKEEFLYQFFRSNRFREQMIASAKGSVILHISKDAILDYDFVEPSSDEVFLAYQRVTNPIVEIMNINVSNSQTLAGMRDVLLPKLISGEIKIPDAEKIIEEAGI